MEQLIEFGKLVKERRREKGLSQEKLSELCGLSTRQIVKIEQGKTNVGFTNLVRLCIECDIDIGELDKYYSSPYEDLDSPEIFDIKFILR